MASSVLIVGAGPAGLSLAIALLRNGVSVKIIDKAPKYFVGTRGAGVMPRTLELYKIAGILPEIESVGNPEVPKMRIYTSPEGDSPINEFDMMEISDPDPSYYRINGLVVLQDDHQAALRGIIEKRYGVSIELATELVSFEQSPDYVTVKLLKSSLGTTETHQFDWVVGTDGARSVVRKQLGLSFDGESNVDICLAMRPYKRNGKQYFWFICGGANVDVQAIEGNKDRLVEIIYDIIGKKEVVFGDLVAYGTWRSNVRMVNKFNEGRVFLGGVDTQLMGDPDAAHVHSFTGAQGINTSVQDSVSCFMFSLPSAV
ncbi:hypothetical protein VNI00_004529 [Paramarasmius palmivorus]|uniref:FAD-binding domain-containing protein n=1 Tax=Paramarasmius palmivorus TaxID=297713 RepID=A0AAW0DJY3_9AGAR